MTKSLRSLTLPIGDNTVKYTVPSSYSYNNIQYQKNNHFAYFGEDDLDFIGIINITLDNEFCTVFYNRSLGIAQILNGSISNAQLNIYTDDESNLSALALNIGGSLNVSILGGYNIIQTTANFSATNAPISLSLNNKSVTVYSGTGDPDSTLGKPGDIYIQIGTSTTTTPTEGEG